MLHGTRHRNSKKASDVLADEALSVAKVIVSAKQWQSYDYLLPDNAPDLQAGMRVNVPFSHSERVGIVLEINSETKVARQRLKRINSVIDTKPLIDKEMLELLQWVSGYYHFPLGEVVLSVFPPRLRRGHQAQMSTEEWFYLAELPEAMPVNAPKQVALLKLLHENVRGLPAAELNSRVPGWRAAAKRLLDRHWIERRLQVRSHGWFHTKSVQESPHSLNEQQQQAVDSIVAGKEQFNVFLLDGVTGSGKTEVYLNVIDAVLRSGKQCMVLVPEIGLTPQTVNRFRRRFDCPVVVLHSNLNETERADAWLAAESGQARIIIGTRSAVFVPCPELGLIVLDEEHDASFKQQEGFRYHARDVAVMRAHRRNIPIVMGTATPSLESYHNVKLGRYHCLHLPQRAGSGQSPRLEILDVRGEKMYEGVSNNLVHKISACLLNHGQVLLFLNRRGYSPLLLCHQCGWVSQCASCDAHMVYYSGSQRLRCHHCGAERMAEKHCPKCSSESLQAVGFGTQRVEKYMQALFPDVEIIRIDRDSTRRKGSLDRLLKKVKHGEKQILIGTQMLAKGHHFPNIELVAVLNADQGLFSQDFRAQERLAQLLVQVAGRAGRSERGGQVYVQTHAPDHPLLLTLIKRGYHGFAEAALQERELAGWPPKSFLALLRADAKNETELTTFLSHAKAVSPPLPGVKLFGPVPAPMEKRAGRWRGQILLQCDHRPKLQTYLERWVGELIKLPGAARVRWSIDVDPVDLF